MSVKIISNSYCAEIQCVLYGFSTVLSQMSRMLLKKQQWHKKGFVHGNATEEQTDARELEQRQQAFVSKC